MKKILILIVAFLLIAANLYAGNGDLIVDGRLGVGTGTTSPQAKLHVGDGSSTNSGVIRLHGLGSASTHYTDLRNNGENFAIYNSVTAGITDFFIDNIGNVGIGTSNPQAKLHVGDGSSTNSGVIRLHGLGSASTNFTDLRNNGENFAIYNSATAGITDFFIDNNGNVGIGTSSPGINKLYVAGGNVYIEGDLNCGGASCGNSDIKFKKDIRNIESPLNKILSIEGFSYKWKTEEYKVRGFPEGRHYGVIAQEIEKVLPEIVKEGLKGEKKVAYMEIIPILIEAIKEQQQIVQNQQKEIAALKEEQEAIQNQQAMISTLFEKVNELEKQVRSEATVALADY